MAKSRYTNWSWQPTSKVERQITTGRQRFTTARELQISNSIGEYTMDQVKAALESVFGPMVTTKSARKVVAKKSTAKGSMKDRPSVRVPVSIKGSPVTGRSAAALKAIKPVVTKKDAKQTVKPAADGEIALKSIVPTGMETKMARRILRKATSHTGGRWTFTKVEAEAARKILAAHGTKA
jgi:hypothetical protein